MDELRLMSRGLYGIMSRDLGTESIIGIRRRVMDLQQRLKTARMRYEEDNEDEILSGSECGGLGLHPRIGT